MSGRIRTIKPEWIEDEKLAAASDEARVMSIALLLLADDYGNGRAHVVYLASNTWPYGSRERAGKAERALTELAGIDFVQLYRVGEQSYFHVRNWGKHQKVDRPSKPRVPPLKSACFVNPREDVSSPRETLALDPIPPTSTSDLDLVLRTRLSGTIGIVRGPAEPISSSKGEAAAEAGPEVLRFGVRGKAQTWGLHQTHAESLQAAFPYLDALGELRKAKTWLESNPGRLKTCRGMPRFLFGWMERASNGGKGMKRTMPYVGVGAEAKVPSLDELTAAMLRGESDANGSSGSSEGQATEHVLGGGAGSNGSARPTAYVARPRRS